MSTAIYSIAPWLQLGGLAVSFLAALFLAISQRGTSHAVQATVDKTSGRQRESSFVILRFPRLWSAGIVLLTIGFALQITGYSLTLTKGGL